MTNIDKGTQATSSNNQHNLRLHVRPDVTSILLSSDKGLWAGCKFDGRLGRGGGVSLRETELTLRRDGLGVPPSEECSTRCCPEISITTSSELRFGWTLLRLKLPRDGSKRSQSSAEVGCSAPCCSMEYQIETTTTDT